MMKLTCRDMGVDCDFVAAGNTAEEVKKKAMDHGMMEHKEMLDKMSETDKNNMMMKMDKMLNSQK